MPPELRSEISNKQQRTSNTTSPEELSERIASVRMEAHCKDFIAECPYDVLCIIFGCLDARTISACLDVSHIWRNQILHIAPIWHKLDMSCDDLFISFSRTSSIMPIFCQYTQEINISGSPSRIVFILQLLSNKSCKFPNLQSLFIQCNNFFSNGDTIDIIEPIYYALFNVADTLKMLHVRSRGNSYISLGRVLSICRRLTDIKLSIEVDTSDAVTEPWMSLDTIEIDSEVTKLKAPQLQAYLRYAPNLRCLLIDNDHFLLYHLIPGLTQLCPKLSIISNYSSALHVHLRSKLQGSMNYDGGLQYLALYSLMSMQRLSPLLECHSSTLKGLYLHPIEGLIESAANWSLLSNFTMPQLTEIYLDNCRSATLLAQIPSLIRNAPGLTSVQLKVGAFGPLNPEVSPVSRDGIFNALAELHHLSSLNLVRFHVDGEAFLRFLERCAGLGRLTHLMISKCHATFTMAGLERAVKIPSLESLSVVRSATRIKESMDHVAKSIGELPRLHHLELQGVELSDQAAQKIASCKSLCRFVHRGVKMSSTAQDILKRGS